MRVILPFLAVLAGLPAALAAGRCREGLNYCGSTLISQVAPYVPPDATFALTAQYNADAFSQKVNLGQGTYRVENGQPWVLPSVQKARESLLSQGLYHEYLPILGLRDFRNEAIKLALGSEIYTKQEPKLAICQSLSGTGALHLAGLLLRSCCRLLPKYYEEEKRELDIESYYSKLRIAEPSSVVILHACAHNPTSCDPSKEQWKRIGSIMKERKLFPLFDAAYLGFNSGSVDNDAFAMRYFVDELEMEAGVYGRIRSMRRALYDGLVQLGAPSTWDHLIRQSGMFGFLGLSPTVVQKLKDEYHIYMAGNSRIPIAGLNPSNVEYVARSIAECLNESQCPF
ncbi:pyridoxal phosphate-dependent transferase [Aspergillus alliaceus]|uniref:Pyridoxal phosphate-dependent transferase n=1 Tax=Petromyces alliaceus TaxID=209559 RepID=A0A5N7CSJ5_PETAA|nr:pyridoxal phosphate-dependent transferase [Aspergillus alliaceus]